MVFKSLACSPAMMYLLRDVSCDRSGLSRYGDILSTGIYDRYLDKLVDICVTNGFRVRRLGYVGPCRAYPFVKVIAGDEDSPHQICFASGIHGEEPAGPFSVLSFLKDACASDFRGLSATIFPVMNPYGFDRGRRRNHNRLDLNRHFFDDPLPLENRLVYNEIRDKDLFFLHTLHEDRDQKNFYLYGYGGKNEDIYRGMISRAGSFFDIEPHKVIEGDKASGGLILDGQMRCEFESRMVKDGVPFVMTSETPVRQPLIDRVECGKALMWEVLRFCKNYMS